MSSFEFSGTLLQPNATLDETEIQSTYTRTTKATRATRTTKMTMATRTVDVDSVASSVADSDRAFPSEGKTWIGRKVRNLLRTRNKKQHRESDDFQDFAVPTVLPVSRPIPGPGESSELMDKKTGSVNASSARKKHSEDTCVSATSQHTHHLRNKMEEEHGKEKGLRAIIRRNPTKQIRPPPPPPPLFPLLPSAGRHQAGGEGGATTANIGPAQRFATTLSRNFRKKKGKKSKKSGHRLPPATNAFKKQNLKDFTLANMKVVEPNNWTDGPECLRFTFDDLNDSQELRNNLLKTQSHTDERIYFKRLCATEEGMDRPPEDLSPPKEQLSLENFDEKNDQQTPVEQQPRLDDVYKTYGKEFEISDIMSAEGDCISESSSSVLETEQDDKIENDDELKDEQPPPPPPARLKIAYRIPVQSGNPSFRHNSRTFSM